jgi:hypothetical protein
MGAAVRVVLRMTNVAVALVTMASAVAVLVSDVVVPGYRAHHRDALWFVAAYVAVQVVMLVGFARGGRLVPWLALAKTAAAYLFLLNFAALWPYWKTWTPARYVYQLFEWGEQSRLGLFALVFLGRGAFNTVNAMVLTQHWWGPLRHRRPLLGRLVTAIPVGVTATCVWIFLALAREEAETFSPEAQEVAQLVWQSLDCATVRERAGGTSTDLRQRGERRFEVRVTYGCDATRVVVRAEDGRLGAVSGARPECCRGERAPG